MERARAFQLRIHEKAEFSCEDLEDRIELKLVNKETGSKCERTYYKLEDRVMDVHEALKIDTILYHMHNKVGLNVWDRIKN
jgi:hypothetical protein